MCSWLAARGSRLAAHGSRCLAGTDIEKVRDGTLRGLSLGTDMVLNETGDVLYRAQGELSICEEGRRPGTWIDTVNGKTVHRVACVSAQRAGLDERLELQLLLPLYTPRRVRGGGSHAPG